MIDGKNRGAGFRTEENGGTFGTYDDTTGDTGRGFFARHLDPFARFEALPDMFRRLAAEITSMISLQIALLKAELKDGIKGYAKGSAFLVAAAVPAVLTFLFLEIALGFLLAALFPFSLPVNYGLGFGIIMLLNGIVAGTLAWLGLKAFKKHSLVPERSIEEMEKDKQWLTNEVM